MFSLPKESVNELVDAFKVFDVRNTGKISVKNFKNVLVKIGQDFNENEVEELSSLLYKARKALSDLNICNEVTIVQEERSKHFHIWLFPYYDWMQEKFGKGIKYLRDINEYVIENATEEDKSETLDTIEKLKEYFNK